MLRQILLSFIMVITTVQLFGQSTPPCNNVVPPEEQAGDVIPICDGLNILNQYCLDMMNSTICPNPVPFNGCPGFFLNNPNWFGFVSGTFEVTMILDITNCVQGDGIQFAVYEVQGELGAGCNTNNLPLSAVTESASSLNPLPYCSPPIMGTGEQWTFPTTPGFTYLIVFDGWNNDLCEIRIVVDAGGQAPFVANPTDIIFPPSGFEMPVGGDLDTVCAGAQGIPITADVSNGASSYIWTLPDGSNEITFTPDLLFDVPLSAAGSTLEFCYRGRSDCDTADFDYCEMVYVAALPDVVFDPVMLCEGDTDSWVNGAIGPYNGLTDDFMETLSQPAMDPNFFDCGFNATIDVFVQNENDEAPNPIDTIICGQPPVVIRGNTITEATTGLLIPEAGGASNGCDTFYSLTVDFLYADLTYDAADATCNAGILQVCPNMANYLPALGTPGLTVTYAWTRTSDGATVSDGMECLNLDINSDFNSDVETFEVMVSMTLSGEPTPPCEFGPFSVELDRTDFVPSVAQIDGPLFVCVGETATYNLNTTDVNNPDAAWTNTIAGANVNNITFDEYTLMFSAPGNGQICIMPTNSCGSAMQTCIDVVVRPLPIAGADDFTCGLEYTLGAGSAGGFWFVLDSPSITSTVNFSNVGDPNALVDVDEFGTYTFGWALDRNNCFDDVQVTFLDSIRLDGPETSTCDQTNTNYTIEFTLMGGLPPYTVTSGNGTMNGSDFTSDPIPSNAPFTVTIEDAAGCIAQFSFSPFTCDCITMGAIMDTTLLESCGDAACYQGIANVTDTMMDGNDIAEYVLHTSVGTTVSNALARNNTGEFCFIPGTTDFDVIYYISFVIGDDDGNGNVDLSGGCTRVAAGQPVIWREIPVAAATDGLSTCADSISLDAQPSVGVGTWSMVSGPGMASFSAPNSPGSRVNVTACGVYTFQWHEDNEGCQDSTEVQVEFYCNPEVFSIQAPCNGTGTAIDLTIILDNGTAPYTEDFGMGSINGDTFSIDGLPLNMPDTFYFTDANGCQLTVPVPIGDCSCISQVGTMGTQLVNECQDATITVFYNDGSEVQDANDMTQYIAHTRTDDTIGTIIAVSNTPDFQMSDGPFECDTVYYVSAVVGNWTGSEVDLSDPCLSVAVGQPIRFDCQVVSDAGADTVTCELNVNLIGASTINNGDWVALTPGSSVINLGPTRGRATLPGPGVYSFEFQAGTGSCMGTDTMTITVADGPTIVPGSFEVNCNLDNTEYVVTLQITGGDPTTYMVMGGGTVDALGNYVSDPIPTGGPFILRFSDQYGCANADTIGEYTCPCITNIGELTASVFDLCEEEALDVNPIYNATNEMLDANDVLNFILSDNQLNPTLSILDANTTGIFNYDPAYGLGVTHYVAAIVGDMTSPTTVDINDPCLGVSDLVEVTWYDRIDMFTIDPTALEITCEDPQVTLSIMTSEDLTGYDIEWTATAGGNIEPGDENLPMARVNSAGTYTLTISHPLAGCDETQMIVITQSADVPTAVIADPADLTCLDNQLTLSGAGSSTGPTITYEWVGPGIVGANDNIDVDVNMPGDYTLTVRNTANGCVISVSETVVEDVEEPAATASAMEQIDCDTDQVTVSGLGSAEGANITYAWTILSTTGNIISGADERDIVVDEEGTYQVLVTNLDNGCSMVAQAIVTQEADIISGFMIEENQPGCADVVDGTLTAVDIVGGVGPYTYSFDNGATFSSDAGSGPLVPGTYTVIVRDANNCEVSAMATLNAPFDFSVELGEDQFVQLGESVTLTAITNLPDAMTSSITWTPLFDSANQATLMQEFTPIAGQYVVTIQVENENGCVQEDQVGIFVRFEERVFVPTAMHPGGLAADNNYLNIYADPGSVASITNFAVFDRWGNKVFERRDVPVSLTLQPEFAWDGTKNGEEVAPGVYSYFVELEYVTGLKEVISGGVTLFR